MRQPNHIILDFFTNKNSPQFKYWVLDLKTLVVDNRPIFLKNNFFTLKAHTLKELKKEPKLDVKYINNVEFYFKKSTQSHQILFNNFFYLNNLNSHVDINFLRKERLYTKLKYSRSPAYDIVSGGAAALFAGLLGFLISEKFGIELVDSGDFYYLFMYGVFLSFSLYPLLVVSHKSRNILDTLNPYRIFLFYINFFVYIIRLFKK